VANTVASAITITLAGSGTTQSDDVTQRLVPDLPDSTAEPTGAESTRADLDIFPDCSTPQVITEQLASVVKRYGQQFRHASDALLINVLLPVEQYLQQAPAWALLLVTALLALHATRSLLAAISYTLGLYLIGAVGLWDKLIQTFALVLVATLLSILIGVPVGILGARIRWLRRLLTPVL